MSTGGTLILRCWGDRGWGLLVLLFEVVCWYVCVLPFCFLREGSALLVVMLTLMLTIIIWTDTRKPKPGSQEIQTLFLIIAQTLNP